MESKKQAAKFCGNILVRKARRRSFLAKSLFESVFGVLTEASFEYYQSSAQWTQDKKPQFFIGLVNILSVEEVDDGAFGHALCFQITYHSRTKKDNSNMRTLYLSAYEVEEFESWLSSLRLGIPDIRRQKLSPAITFSGFGVVALESHYSDMPGSLPFSKDAHLTVSDASGVVEWKAFSTTSTSGYGYLPRELVALNSLEEEPWFFGEIPSAITTAILREQVPGCFILRTSGLGARTILSFRTDKTVKHVEVVLDETTHKYRVKDESDSVCYANFLQFDSIQQLLDQCKQHATLGTFLEKYPTLKNSDEIWKVDWAEIEAREERDSDLPWIVLNGKFQNKEASIHILPEGSSDILKEKFSNQSRLMMTLNHQNIVRLHGVGLKGPRNFIVHENLCNGDLLEYLRSNASLLSSQPSELRNILNHVINGMVYLHENSVEHGELKRMDVVNHYKGKLVSQRSSLTNLCRSPWCKQPLSDEGYKNKVPIPAPELSESWSWSDVWAFGFFIFTVVTVGEKPIASLHEVSSFTQPNEAMDDLGRLVEKIKFCLQKDPNARPTFQELRDQVSNASSTQSCSSHSLEDALHVQFIPEETVTVPLNKPSMNGDEEPEVFFFEDENAVTDWDSGETSTSQSREDLRQRLKHAELAALKANALQKRAEAAKDCILRQVQEAEAKCLREVEMITKSFLKRLTEANDRAAEAEQARYLAEEVKRLTEEKYTLYKYESEKNMHDLKAMFDDALLERDELMAALKTVGKDFDSGEMASTKRRDSIRHLEGKYQRYISTSDRTIQSLKTQLSGVVKHRDQLASDREAIRNEMRDTREALEQAVKEKEEFQFRLEEAQFETERLEEMISTMTQKRQQAERERDQLQMLTDMSLMKLRQAESVQPKKRASVVSMPPRMNERAKETQREPSLRRLSQHLLHMITPSGVEKSLNSGEIEMNVVPEDSILEDQISSQRMGKFDLEEPHKEPEQMISGEEVVMPVLEKSKVELQQRNLEEAMDASSRHDHIHETIEPEQELKENHGKSQKSASRKTSLEYSDIHEKHIVRISADQSKEGSQAFLIPTLHIEEADNERETTDQTHIPGTEISQVDGDEAFKPLEEGETYPYDYHQTESPMFIIEGEDGNERILYSIDDVSELFEGIPQTTL
ncbi:Tyrosine-protein kinase abl-1 [Acropora cervicornis]|uniref:Tyrosine-protein kinase n=1 Tax=Acropora cervicornis TaxID=6130 RepID=A0AAD9V6J1_ACRCE|nr:Tyrosine-protein kinase abl-1 [Acropora cervicornis]